MKLNNDNLDAALVEKINRLDAIIDKNDSGFVGFNNGEFHIKKVNEALLRKMTSDSEIERLSSHMYSETNHIKNGFNSNFNINNRANVGLRNQIVSIDGLEIFSTEDVIQKVKMADTYCLILDSQGMFYKYSFVNREVIFQLNIAEKVSTLFAIKDFQPYDVLDFEIFKGGFLFSTKQNGVFFADVPNNSLEILYPEHGVILIKVLNDKDIMFLNKNGHMSMYNFESTLKTETYKFLTNNHQRAKKIEVHADKVVILAEAIYNTSTEGVLHILEKDLADVSYNNISGKIYPNYETEKYKPTFISADGEYIYLAGLKDGKYLFLWKYSIANLHHKPVEILFNLIEIDKLNFVRVHNGEIFFNFEDRLIIINEKCEILKNLKLDKFMEITDILFQQGSSRILIITDNKVQSYIIPEYVYEAEYTAELYNGSGCNNFEVIINMKNGNDIVMFMNGETLEQIHPLYYLSKDGTSYVRLTGKVVKQLLAKITVLEGMEYEGIVVNSDTIYIK